MADIAKTGEYTGTGAKVVGDRSVTDVTVPAHTSALIFFHFFDSAGVGHINHTSTLPVLSGATAVWIGQINNGSNNDCEAFWVTGAVVGASKTLSYTVQSSNFESGTGITILFLSGTETTDIIESSATDSDTNGGSTSGAMTFTAGNWTVMGYDSDLSIDATNSGANTTQVAEFISDTLACGIVSKTNDGTIRLPVLSNTFTAIVACVVKAAPDNVQQPIASLWPILVAG